MALSKDLINQFVKLTTPEQQPTETTVNGTYKKVGNVEYVQIDGSDILTPVESTVTADNDDRVQVLIKNHKAIITGNITSPSARHKHVSTIKDEVDEFGTTIEQKQSRALKAELMGKVSALIKETYDVDTAQTSDGLYLLIPNDEEGSIPVLLDIKMKPLDTDIETLTAEYQKKQEEKAEKAAAAAAKKAKDIAAKQAKQAKNETEDAKEAE